MSGKSLVIVESPAKARTIANFLGEDYVVESSIGHIRDLPTRASEVPKDYQKESWARLGVNVEQDFEPLYVINPDKKKQVTRLRQLMRDADTLLLATDEDREGESIAWHLVEVLKPRIPVKRMVFHEITRKAISQAIEHPREIDRGLVDAQEARRILDRLYGYEVSPVLWKKVMPRLSAGRVQSVAVRVIVERERARMRFVTANYWDIEGQFRLTSAGPAPRDFAANLIEVGGKRVATGKDFGEDGKLTRDGVVVLDEARATSLAQDVRSAALTVHPPERKPYRRSPAAPFMTSTLQQEAGRKLRFSSARTMQVAQRLYENGYITYMRTDSTTLSEVAIEASRNQVISAYGREFLPDSPRVYRKKVKNAQEAHEAIRPAGDVFRTPEEVAREVSSDEARLYDLIWKRTVASQMEDLRGESVQVRVSAKTAGGEDLTFAASGKTITFPGFLRAYVEGSDDPDAELESKERHLPVLEGGEDLAVDGTEPKGHETQPPARFTEASLVKRLEELGVGRPSTYASIISTIQDRGYVWKKGSALVPSFTSFAVVAILEQHFPDLVDYAFTARMEDDLDGIASGEERSVPWLRRFYFGDNNGSPGLREMVSERLSEIDARAVNSIELGIDPDGKPILARVGRYGPYLQRGEDTVSVPEDLPPDELTVERAVAMLEAPSGDRELGEHPETGETIYLRRGRFGPYVQAGEASASSKTKPKTASLLRSMDAEDLRLEEAVMLLSLPRVIGEAEDGEVVTAQNGRYGPYISKGAERRSLETEEQIFRITMREALELLSKPRERRRRGASAEPLRTLDADPVSGNPIVVRDGRFGPYVTDGETIASLRKGDAVDAITTERAAELIQLKRERGPGKKKAKKKVAKKAATKKAATKKKATKKKATKKAATKKKTTKKAATKKAAAKKADSAED